MLTIPDPDWPYFTIIPAEALWIELAEGPVYVKRRWLEENLAADIEGKAEEYCFRLTGYPVTGM